MAGSPSLFPNFPICGLHICKEASVSSVLCISIKWCLNAFFAFTTCIIITWFDHQKHYHKLYTIKLKRIAKVNFSTRTWKNHRVGFKSDSTLTKLLQEKVYHLWLRLTCDIAVHSKIVGDICTRHLVHILQEQHLHMYTCTGRTKKTFDDKIVLNTTH